MTPPPAPYKVSLDFARHFLEFSRAMGLPLDEALAREGLHLEPLPDAPGFIAGPVFERILALGLRLVPDPLPGLVAAEQRGTALLSLADFLLQDASTLGALLRTLIQVEPMGGDAATTRLRHHGREVELLWECRFRDAFVCAHTADFILAGYATAVHVAARPGQRVIAGVHFRHDPPADLGHLHRYLEVFGAPVYFRQAEDALLLPAAALELPLPAADPLLYGVLERHARKLLRERRPPPVPLDLARSVLHQLLLEGNASKEQMAARMGLTVRTLHHRLQQAGSSYRALLEELRLAATRAALRDPGLTLQEVAVRAGFEEGGSFARWFRQATGESPRDWREQQPRSGTAAAPEL